MRSSALALVALLAAGTAVAQPSQGPQPTPLPPPVAEPRDVAYPGVITVDVDATDLERRIFRVRQTIPVTAPGPMTIHFPKWVPGGHAPRNPIYNIAGLTFRADGQPLAWKRDPIEVFSFHVTPPAGARTLEVEFQHVTPTAADQGRVLITPEMLNAQWISLAMYPAGYYMRRIPVDASIRLPAGWGYGTAMETESEAGGVVRFKRTDFDTFTDSPLFAGKYFKRYDLDTSGKSPVRLNIVADRPELLAATPEQIEKHRELVRQADKLFGARHFDHYDFLLALTERMGGIGLEHQRSSENGTTPTYFTEWSKTAPARNLLPHEYAHSWDGKYRRPADLWRPTLNEPMRDSLLWVYEGQDQYWGFVLGARSGLVTKQQTLDALAMTAATFSEGRPGAQWRSVEDTTNDPILAGRRPIPWTSWQRSEDYYSEGQLVWLDVDTLIRERSGGRKSLDDFAKAFFGVNDGEWKQPLTYTFEEVVETLNKVQPYDWGKFLDVKLRQVSPEFPLAGVERGGYRLIYTETPTDYWTDNEASRKIVDLTYSGGLVLNREARITGVLWDSAAFKAGLTVGDQILAVNGIAYDTGRFKEAIKAAKAGEPISLIVKDGDHFRTVAFEWRGGLRYPRLERIEGAPDRLGSIYAPRK
ncbi:PDZ domain-containing protein [Phenylobacterium sp. J426]|uniref:M61 family metallopeptidase n=1 Tax=Phenylobacterium sp. J426 TaxID=2898439 RepID=UPI0021515FAD|nr:PDZ domain-containing protein [Phenylobacterium sp. J426]MCR5875576.1 PDZ domain-containing protein [Phenylobacterium sp. J426]